MSRIACPPEWQNGIVILNNVPVLASPIKVDLPAMILIDDLLRYREPPGRRFGLSEAHKRLKYRVLNRQGARRGRCLKRQFASRLDFRLWL